MDKEITKLLDEDLDRSRIKIKTVGKTKDGKDRKIEYLKGHDDINAANRIFGYGNWGTDIKAIDIKEAGGKTIVVASVRVDVVDALPRTDVGVLVAAQQKGQEVSAEALETAIKGAVTDGMKRGLRHFGKQFGNDLYAEENDKAVAKPQREAKPTKGRKKAPSAEKLRDWILLKAQEKADEADDSDHEKGISEAQTKLLGSLLSKIFGTSDSGEVARHQFCEYVFGRMSLKELTMWEASSLIEWAKEKDTYNPDPTAEEEAQMVLRAWGLEQGQQEMFEDEPPF